MEEVIQGALSTGLIKSRRKLSPSGTIVFATGILFLDCIAKKPWQKSFPPLKKWTFILEAGLGLGNTR